MGEWFTTNQLLGLLTLAGFYVGYYVLKALDKVQERLENINTLLARMDYRQRHNGEEPPW